MTLAERARAQRAEAKQASDPRERFTLAPALDGSAGEWHEVPTGYVGITRHVSAQGDVRDFVTYAPTRGRTQSVPLSVLFEHPEIAGAIGGDESEEDESAPVEYEDE